MAKKSSSNIKPAIEPDVIDEPEVEAPVVAKPAAKSPEKSEKPVEDHSDGGIGVAEIKKAVSFANSVGGLEKAIALLQILKVAKDVQ